MHGPAIDEPIVWYEGSGTSDRRWLAADQLGTITAVTDGSGAVTTIYAYDEYGRPNTWTGARFRFTGQMALPEAQLYHYRARAYDPALGRFLQTDPIGYIDDLNLYSYVGNSPLSARDPSGSIKIGIGIEGEFTAGHGLGGGLQFQVSFPVPFIDPTAEFDFGATVYGSARVGVLVGGGPVVSVQRGSIRDTPTIETEVDVTAGNPSLQGTVSQPVRLQDGRPTLRESPDAGASGGRTPQARANVEARVRTGLSTGGFSEGVRVSWNGSARRAVDAILQMFNPRPRPASQESPQRQESRDNR